MDRVSNWLSLALFVAYLGKTLFISASIPDALVVISLLALVVYFDYMANRKQLDIIKKQLELVETETRKELEFLRGSISGVKLAQGLKSTITQNR